MPFFKDETTHALVVRFAMDIVAAMSALDAFTQGNPEMQSHLQKIKTVVMAGGVNVDAVGPCGSTPLLMACSQGNLPAVKSLLMAGADPCLEALEHDDELYKEDKCKEFPLSAAAYAKHPAIVEWLLKQDGICPNQTTSDTGCTALYSACHVGCLGTVQVLMQVVGLDPNLPRADDGATPLYAAADNGHHDVVRFLMAHKGQIQLDLNQSRSDDGATPLYGACFAGHTNVVEALLENSAVNVNQCRMVDGATPFHVACDLGHVDIVRVLLATGLVNANQVMTDKGAAPLKTARENECSDTFGSFPTGAMNLQASRAGGSGSCAVDVNHINNGDTALHTACYKGHMEVVKCLLACTDIQCNMARAVDGETALFIACRLKHMDVIEALLLHKDIDVNKVRPADDVSAFHVACASGHADVARRLLVHGSVDINRGTTADGYTALHAACEHGHVEVVNELLKHPDIRVNQGTMRDQMAPIHIACDAAHIDVVRALLAHGRVQLNRPLTAEGATPSHFAAFHGKLPLVQLCGVYGGRFDIPDKDGDLPFSDSDLMASVEPDLKEWMASSRGWSPLRIAAGARLHDDIVAALRVGAMDPDSQDSVQELLAAEATAWTEATDLPWATAPALCKKTAKLVSAVIRGWLPSTNWLHHAGVHRSVHTVLLVSERLQRQHNRAVAAAAEPHLGAAEESTQEQPAQQQLQLLPPEMWLLVMGFFQRQDWKTSMSYAPG